MHGVPWVLLLCSACAASGGSSTGDSGSGGVDAGTGGDAAAPDASFRDAGPPDAGGLDAGTNDAGPEDAGPVDAGATDAGPPDAGPADAGPPDAGPPDAGPPDAGPPDAGPLDAGPGTPVSYLCVPAVSGNELNAGLVFNSSLWTGFRFQVTAGTDVTTTRMEINLRSSGAGTLFGALVRLTGPSDTPDAPDLTGSDVIATTTLTVTGGTTSVTKSAPITATLSPGWYAAIFGTGAFGTSLTGATVHSNSGSGGCGSGFGYPFTIRQSDGMFILQAATPHFQVDGMR